MNESYILIETEQPHVLKKVLKELAELYSDTGFTNGLKLFEKSDDQKQFLLVFTKEPDFDRFGYFVNFLKYPIENDSFSSHVRGYFKNDNSRPKIHSSEWLLFYMADNGTPPDAVSLVSEENKNFLFDFGGKISPQERPKELFNMSVIDRNAYQHVITISPSKTSVKSTKSSINYSEIISDIIAILTCFSVVAVMITLGDTDAAEFWFALIFFGIGGLFMLWKVIFPGKYESMKYYNRKKRK